MRIDEGSGLAVESGGAEQRLAGLGVSPGIAIGPAYVGDGGDLPVHESHIPETEIAAERGRFAEAVAVSLKQLRKIKAKASSLPESAAEEIGYLLDAHLAMLSKSRLVRGVDERIGRNRINAERAVEIEIDEIARSFAAMRDPYLAGRIEDIRVVGTRLIRNLIKKPYVAFSGVPEGAVILADELTPADTALMDPRRIAGFATQFGGADSHTAIVARALGLPAVLAVPTLVAHARADATVVIDGAEGTVIIDPSAETIGDYQARRDLLTRERRHLTRLRRLPAATRDGVEITLEANLELPVELDQAAANGAMGLGLVRSEFLYMNRDDLPGEDEQYAVFSALVRGMQGKPVTVRTFDLGGDKLARSLADHFAPADNPALGLRAIRLSLQDRRLLDPQLAAMLRAAAEGPLRILLPMISTPGELRQVREAMEQVARRLRRRGMALPKPLPPLGAMIEVPGAALGRRRARRRSRFLCDRHQRPHSIHPGDRPQRRAGGASLQPAAPGGAAAHPICDRGGVAPRHADQPVRRDGRRAAVYRTAARPRAAQPVDGAAQHPAGQAAHPLPRHGRRHPPRPRHHGPIRFRPHRRPPRRLQHHRLAALAGGCGARHLTVDGDLRSPARVVVLYVVRK